LFIFSEEGAMLRRCPTEIQLEYFRVLPIDMMTSFEGLVLSYGPEGNVTWWDRNPSTYVPD
jgi:hypothetical protein